MANQNRKWVGVGIGLGLPVGAAFGVILDALALCLGLGVVIGALVDVVIAKNSSQ